MRQFCLFLMLACGLPAQTARAPYPPSPAIAGITVDWTTHDRRAPGSDNWQLTWAEDDHQYAAWGDGGGFDGTNSAGRVSLGVARVEGPWNNYRGFNVWGGKDAANPATFEGKSWGMLAVGGALYMWVSPRSSLKDMQTEARLHRSADKGATWTPASWAFTRADGLTIPTICQFGRGYSGARDGYVYHYFVAPADDRAFLAQKPGAIYLVRAPKNRLMDRAAYEFFVGFGAKRQPLWNAGLASKKPVFEDPAGTGWNVSVSYNAGLRRYILMTEHTASSRGNLGVFDAPQPWGPWTTVLYLNESEGNQFGAGKVPANTFFWNIPTKWQNGDGREFTLVFTGAGLGKDNDSWNALRGGFTLRR